MSIYDYEEAFGAWDITSRPMRRAIREWFRLYYQPPADPDRDGCQRIGYTVVSKLVKTMFGEYKVLAEDPAVRQIVRRLDDRSREAVQLALVGGECYIKPCLSQAGFSFTLIGRDNVLIFGRNAEGEPVDVGTAERSVLGNRYYTLLERRRVDSQGRLTIENTLYRSGSAQSLGTRVPLTEHPDYATLAEKWQYDAPLGLGLVRVKTPMLNCVDGSADPVAVYAPAVGLIRNIDRNEAQLCGEFDRGQSRILVSRDLLRDGQLQENLFVGLDEDPENLGMTIFAPSLREQSFLARKQEYLRNVESIIGLRRGTLSDANVEERTATEIASSAGDFNLTVMDFQQMWERAVQNTVKLCALLAGLYGQPVPEDQTVSIDWGNGILYDEDQTWERYRQMVGDGLLKPEIALGWRFNMPTNTDENLAAIRRRLMPN